MGRPGDRFEQEADRAAEELLSPLSGGFARVEPAATGPLGPQAKAEAAPSGAPWTPADLGAEIDAVRGQGQPLPGDARSFFEPRLGHRFDDVRVHADDRAAGLASAARARAFTVGQDIFFGGGQYAPGNPAGARLLAHELAHTVQQRGVASGSPALLQREPDDRTAPRDYRLKTDPALLGPIFIPGLGVTATAGPIVPTSILGAKLPLPASLTLTNAAGGGAGPTFLARLSPRFLVAGLLETIDLSTSLRPGTPEDRLTDPSALNRISLVNPVITINPATGALSGFAKLRVGSDYPLNFKGPTELDVEISSTALGAFTGTIGIGPLHADFQLKFKYDTAALEQALKPAIAPSGGLAAMGQRLQKILTDNVPGIKLTSLPTAVGGLLQAVTAGKIKGIEFATAVVNEIASAIPPGADLASLKSALSQFADELARPGYSASGTVKLGPLPITAFSASSTGTKTPSTEISAAGVIIVPAGTVASVAAPALGATTTRTSPASTFSATIAALPSISTEAMSKKEPFVNQFPIYSFAEISYARSVGKEAQVGVRFTLNVATPEIPKLVQILKTGVADPKPGPYEPGPIGALPPLPPPNVGLTIFGNF